MTTYQLTTDEVQLIRNALPLGEIDSKLFVRNLMQLGRLTHEAAHNLFVRAVNVRAIVEDRGRVRISPPPSHPKALSAIEIGELEQSGYTVGLVIDVGPPRYRWRNRSGAEQPPESQPFRSTQAQAWVDCKKYHFGGITSVPEPDWNT